LRAAGRDLVAVVRPGTATGAATDALAGTDIVRAEVTIPDASETALAGRRLDAAISCLASRSGAPAEVWDVEYRAQRHALAAARAAGARQMVLLSAICVQKPRLAFQHAKLAFETELQGAGLAYSIVRPTAYFKSLSGQVERVKAGKPFLIFGDGRGTACKPIGDADLADYLVDCLDDPDRHGKVLPIGGPGPALTPREIGGMLFDLTGRAPRFKSVPPGFLTAVAGALGLAGRISRKAADKAEFARIGHYYATESMLVWDSAAGRYDAAATPETGRQTLGAHLAALVRGEIADDRGAHAVF